MLVIFFDAKGVIHKETTPCGLGIGADVYLELWLGSGSKSGGEDPSTGPENSPGHCFMTVHRHIEPAPPKTSCMPGESPKCLTPGTHLT